MDTINHFTDLYAAEKIAKNYDAVISLGHKLDSKFLKEGCKYLFRDFDDVSLEEIAMIGNSHNCPAEHDIRLIIEFVKELLPSDKLLIHCYAGYSRSAAGLLIAKCERDKKTIYEARNELYDSRVPDKLVPCPNNMMVHTYLMIK